MPVSQPQIRQFPRRRLAAVAAGLAVALAASGCGGVGQDAVAQGGTFEFVSPGGQIEMHYPVEERKPVAELAGPDVLDPDETIRLQQDFAGQVVLLNTWGQWCAPCRSEVDDLQRLQEEFEPEGFTVLGINLRDPNRDKPVDFLVDNGVTYPSIWDPTNAAVAALQGFPTSVVPATLLLDKEHRVAAVYLREIADYELQEPIAELLAEPAATASGDPA